MGHWTQEARRGSTGWTYKQWVFREARVPRIHPDILDCAIYLYHSRELADAGGPDAGGGSGFLVGVPVGSTEPLAPLLPSMMAFSPRLVSWETPHIYAVTNKHVILSGALTIRLNTQEEATKKTEIISTVKDDWMYHGDGDVAVCPLRLDPALHRFSTIHYHNLLTLDGMTDLHVGIGDDILTIGRFLNSEGKQRNTPVARFGNLAAFLDEPISIGYPGIKPQDGFLAEVRTISGFSGSPVFLRIPHWELMYSSDFYRQHIAQRPEPDSDLEGTGKLTPVTILKLLGVAWGYVFGRPLKIKHGQQELRTERTNSGMMGVVPSWKLLEVLNCSRFQQLREKERGEWEASQGGQAG